MALIKCTECGQDISTDAKMCPHCGKPSIPIVAEKIRNNKGGWKATIWSIILVSMLMGGAYLIRQYQVLNSSYFGPGTFVGDLSQSFITGNYGQVLADIFGQQKISATIPTPNSSEEIPLQEIKNLGYDFYVGQIDSANTVDITDDIKNQITKIAYDAHFSISLLKNVPIIILNNLALTGNQYILIANNKLRVPDLKPDWLSEGGIYGTFTNGTPIIFINKPIIAQGKLTEVLTHELGHAIGSKLTDADWKKFYQLRNIPSTTPRQGTNWNLSPQEDFAEVYKNTFTGIEVRTYYGLLVPSIAGMDMGACMKIHLDLQSSYTNSSMPKANPNTPYDFTTASNAYSKIDFTAVESKVTADPKMQNCRRDVMVNPSKYPTDWQWGTPYKSSVGAQTKSFINEIMNRLNQ